VVETGCFVLNIPDESLVGPIWALIERHGAERTLASGWTLLDGAAVAAPRIAEFRAHLECVHDRTIHWGPEVLIVGRVVAGSIDEACRAGGPLEQYASLRPVFFLEDGTYGRIDGARRVGAACPAGDALHYLVSVHAGELPAPVGRDVLEAHVRHLRELQDAGHLVFGGAFDDDPAPGGATGLYALRCSTLDEARVMADADPLVQAGAAVHVRRWRRSF